MNEVKVSVIMPVYNSMEYFKKALESVMAQTLRDIEILVVDAGSTDGLTEYVASCQENDSRIRLLQCNKKSMGAQCNLGIEEAKGVYVGFCESDDYIESNMMERLYNEAEIHAYPDAVKAGFYFFFDDNGQEFSLPYGVVPRNRLDIYGKVISLDDCHDLYFRDLNMWNGIYRRSFINKNEIYLNESPGASFQDVSFVQQVNIISRRQMFINEFFYHYRQDNSGSSIYGKTTCRFVVQESRYMIDFMNRHLEYKAKYGHLMLNRMYGALGPCYAQDFYWKDEEDPDVIKELIEFQNEFMMFWSSLRNFVSGIFVFPWANFQSVATMKANAFNEYHMANQRVYELGKFLQNQPVVVILGSGEVGQCFYAFLKKNKYNGSVIFADNNEQMQGKFVLGVPVLSFEEVCKAAPNGVFVIVNQEYFNDMSSQLYAYHIKTEQIIVPTKIFPHTAMTTRWDMKPKSDYIMQ